MEFIVQIKAIQKYISLGYSIDQLSVNTWNIILKKMYPSIKNETRGGYDAVVSRDGERIGMEVKLHLSVGSFQNAIGQCATRLCKYTGTIDKAVIPYNSVNSEDLPLFKDTIKKFNLPIELEQIDVSPEEFNLKYWYEFVDAMEENPSIRKQMILSQL
jgi:hypothetical protein